MSAQAPSGEPATGQVLDGRYRLVERLGRGGFGDVWRADELLPDGAPFRQVALKLLTSGFDDFVSWSEEAKLLASFRHPSLVTIYAAGLLGATAPQPYVAMELLEGQTLADLHKARGWIPWRRVLSWALDVAAALDVIHARGVVHLDLKPANLFVAEAGALKVLDFGIARRSGAPASHRTAPPAYRVRSDEPRAEAAALFAVADTAAVEEAFAATRPAPGASTTTRRAVIGTPGFMAPEILEGREPTAATDAYALAVCIAQLCTGRLPQDAPDEPPLQEASMVSAWVHRLRAATLGGELRSLHGPPAHMPRALVELLCRLLAVDPEKRGVPAGQLRVQLQQVWHLPHGVPDPPYAGLSPLGVENEGMLFGRDDDVARLGRELEFSPGVVLQGARGSGKTSLLLAGLCAHLGRAGVDGKDDWVPVRIQPGEAPDRALGDALARCAAAPWAEGSELAGGVAELEAFCAKSPVGLLLVVDPLEDVVSAPLPRDELMTLVSALLQGAPRPGVRLAAALREDSTTAVMEVFARAEGGGGAPSDGDGSGALAVDALRAALRFLGPPSAAAVRDLVAGPARAAGARVGAIDRVISDVQRELRAGAHQLPFVALALAAWWQHARPRTDAPASAPAAALDGAAWQALGGMGGALAKHADRALAALAEPRRAIADELLVRLAATDGTPIRWSEAELFGAVVAERSEIEATVRALAHARLLRSSDGHIELAHPALSSQWPHMVTLRMDAMERLVFLERVREAALAWERSGHHADFLWRGPGVRELADRRGWIDRGLSPLESSFVLESRRRERRRSIGRLGAMAAIGMVVGGALLAKLAADRDRHEQQQRRAEAEGRAYLSDAIAKSRRTEDPFVRAAWIAEAMAEGHRQGSIDGVLPLDLAVSVRGVPSATFLTLDAVSAPSFYWEDRWLVGSGAGGVLAVVDLRPPDPDVVEGLPIDADPEQVTLTSFREPRVTTLRPHADPVVQRMPLSFDSALVTRSVSGEVRVWRLREDGSVALAAIAPMRCRGGVRAAEAAPVLACETEEGIARWDVRRMRGAPDGAGSVATVAFPGQVLDVSADGEHVAASYGRRVLVWQPSAGREIEIQASRPPVLGRWSPRDRVLALAETARLEVWDPARVDAPIHQVEGERAPTALRWDAGGLDVALCGDVGGRWLYLRPGGRAADDPPAPTDAPCGPPPRGWRQPTPLSTWRDWPDFADRALGPHGLANGWRLPDGRYLSRDLVLFGSAAPAASSLLHFAARTATGEDEPVERLDSVSAVATSGDGYVAWQIADEVRLYHAHDGRRAMARKGNLLGPCDDGRLLAWRADGASYRLFDVRSDATLGAVPRAPGLIVAATASCATLYTQRLDGTLLAHDLRSGAAARELTVADGYVYDARRSVGRGATAPGVLMALSSGAVARIDGEGDAVRVVGWATPRADAIGDGAAEGELSWIDASGVISVDRDGRASRLLELQGGATWEDLRVSADGGSMLLASADRVSVLDLRLREIVGGMAVERGGRLGVWDSDGSVVVWSYGRAGGARGVIVPRGLPLARRVAESLSNLEVRERRLVLRRAP
jgi:serine/threonine protein kinase